MLHETLCLVYYFTKCLCYLMCVPSIEHTLSQNKTFSWVSDFAYKSKITQEQMFANNHPYSLSKFLKRISGSWWLKASAYSLWIAEIVSHCRSFMIFVSFCLQHRVSHLVLSHSSACSEVYHSRRGFPAAWHHVALGLWKVFVKMNAEQPHDCS